MGSFKAEAGTDVSLGGGKVKSSEDNFDVDTADEQGVRGPRVPVPQDGKNPNELPSLRSADDQKVDESQRPLKEGWGYIKPGEPDYVQKCNGNPDSQIYENGDGDLPSFSIRRLRRLPLRATSDQQPSVLASVEDRNRPDDDRGEWPAVGKGDEEIEQRQTLLDPSAVGAVHSSGDSAGVPNQVQSSFDSSRSKDFTSERPLNVLEEGTNQVGASGVQNGEIDRRNPELENGKLAIEEPEFRNPDNGDNQSVERVNVELPLEREEQERHVLGQGISEENKDVASEYASNSSDALEGEGESKSPQSHQSLVSSPNPEVERTAPVDDLDVSPETSDIPSGVRDVSEKDSINHQFESPAPTVEDPDRDALTDDNGKVREDVDLGAPTKPAELPSPGIVQVLPPVMGSRFGSPGETTDEETDSPRSSEGFSYPDSDAMTLPYSGQIMYPSRFSCAQSSNGPGLLQYSGSMSLRSDSSTTSNRSFAFPILAPPEWNSSPARMAKAHPRRKNRFDGCCFFRLSRSRYKY